VVPVHKPQLFQALKEPAIHEEFLLRGFDEVLGASNSAGGAEKVDEDFVVHVLPVYQRGIFLFKIFLSTIKFNRVLE